MEASRLELEAMDFPLRSPGSIAEYCESWLKLREGSYGPSRTAEREALDVRHIVELSPNAKLRSLTAPMIHAAYDEARASGRFGKEICQINKRLRQILDAAVEDGLIKKNPARKVSVARPDPEPKDYLDPPRLAAFNAAVLAMPWCGEKIATLILLHTEIRPGEVYAFSWADLSFARCRLDVSRQYSNDMELRRPKSRASIDWVAVDSALWSHLAEWKLAQRDPLARVGVEQHQDTPIVTNSLGGRFDPTNFGRWFRNFCADNGFGEYSVVEKTFVRNGKTIVRGKGYKGLCPNMFRDIQATAMVGYLDADPRTLQARMRHSDPSISLRYYTHPVEDNEYRVAEGFAQMIEGRSESTAAL